MHGRVAEGVDGGELVPVGPAGALALVDRLLGLSTDRPPTLLEEAQARLFEMQALEIAKRLGLDEPVREPMDPLDVLPTRFDLIAVGPKGSGKSRWVRGLGRSWPGRARSFVAELPDWSACAAGDLVCFDDIAGIVKMKRGDDELAELTISRARHLNLSTVWIGQSVTQVPLWLLEHGVWIVCPDAPWAWRFAARFGSRPWLADALDRSFEVLKGAPPGCVALTDPEGVTQLVNRWPEVTA